MAARFGATRQVRTADLILTKDALCLLSYSSKSASSKQDFTLLLRTPIMATQNGLEPSTSSVTG